MLELDSFFQGIKGKRNYISFRRTPKSSIVVPTEQMIYSFADSFDPENFLLKIEIITDTPQSTFKRIVKKLNPFKIYGGYFWTGWTKDYQYIGSNTNSFERFCKETKDFEYAVSFMTSDFLLLLKGVSNQESSEKIYLYLSNTHFPFLDLIAIFKKLISANEKLEPREKLPLEKYNLEKGRITLIINNCQLKYSINVRYENKEEFPFLYVFKFSKPLSLNSLTNLNHIFCRVNGMNRLKLNSCTKLTISTSLLCLEGINFYEPTFYSTRI